MTDQTLFPVPPRGLGLSGAVLSACGTYRYTLERIWDDTLPQMLFVMLNPSTADAAADDPTIRRCRFFATREGCGGLSVVNLFALRATDPTALKNHPDPVGPENAVHIALTLDRGPAHVVAAWGAHPFAKARAASFVADFPEVRFECLGTTQSGAPRHPLYVRGDAPLLPLTVDRSAA